MSTRSTFLLRMPDGIQKGRQCMHPVRSLPETIIKCAKTCIVHKRCTDEIIIFKYAERSVSVCLIQLYKILRAVEALQLDKENCIMIGDRMFDIEGAVEAGVDSIGVTYGFGDRAELVNAGAMYIVDSPKEILSVIGIQ